MRMMRNSIIKVVYLLILHWDQVVLSGITNTMVSQRFISSHQAVASSMIMVISFLSMRGM